VVLVWNDGPYETEYQVLRRRAPEGFPLGPVEWQPAQPANTTTYTDDAVRAGWRYQYRIRACNTGVCSEWVTIHVVAPGSAVPPKPSAFAANAPEDGVQLTWNDRWDETEYRIQRARIVNDAVVENVLLAKTAQDASSYFDYSAAAGERYRYRIRACGAGGCS